MNFKDLKKLKGFSIVIIPVGAGVETKSRHFSAGKFAAIVGTFTFIVFFLGFFLLNITPVRTVFFPRHQNLTPSEKQLIGELNKRLTSKPLDLYLKSRDLWLNRTERSRESF